MSKHQIEWKDIKGQHRTEQLRCMCGSLFIVSYEPVARKVRKRNAHDMRIVVRCPICGGERTIARGARS